MAVDASEVRLTCPLCRSTLVAARTQFPEMAHSDVVAMNFLQKAMETHWARFCDGGREGGADGLPRTAAPQRMGPIVTFIRQGRGDAGNPAALREPWSPAD